MSEEVTIDVDDEEIEVSILVDDPSAIEVELEVVEPIIIFITAEESS